MYTDFNYLIFDNIIYTVDMLRLKTYFTVDEFSKLELRIKTIYKDFIKNNYTSLGIAEFRNNFHIEISEGISFWFGFLHNSELYSNSKTNEACKYNFTIEFNPNKVPFSGILSMILNSSRNWILKSLDMAMDIKVNILDLCGFDKGRKKDIRVFSAGGDNKTIYIGRSDNRVKIYNKRKESDLNYDLTRVEITSKLDYDLHNLRFFNYNITLPDIFLNNYLYTFSDYKDKTLLAVLYAVQNGFNLNDLSRRYKDKITKLLSAGYKINFSNKYCSEVIKKCLLYYFPYLQ